MAISKEFVQSVRRRIAEDPALPTDKLAGELNAREADVVMALPTQMRLRARSSDAPAIWESVCAEDGIVIIRAPSGTSNGAASLRKAESRPPEPVREFLAAGELAAQTGDIWFVSRQDHDAVHRSVRFFDKQGRGLVSVHLDGSDSKDRERVYENLRRRFGVTPMPRMRCRGCTACTCADKATRR